MKAIEPTVSSGPTSITNVVSTSNIPGPKSGNTAAKRKAQENAVIKIIQKEWERETERLDIKKNGPYAKTQNAKNLGDKSLV